MYHALPKTTKHMPYKQKNLLNVFKKMPEETKKITYFGVSRTTLCPQKVLEQVCLFKIRFAFEIKWVQF